MKSISKLAVAAAVMVFTSAASAGTLYWQVNGEDLEGNLEDWGAELWMLDTTKSQGDTGYKTSLSGGLEEVPTGILQADITNYTDDKYLFFVELYNYANDTSTEGYKWGYQDLVSSGYVAFGATDIPTVNATVGDHGNFANVPEPSSGLLLLMGGAMLALRRRRQK